MTTERHRVISGRIPSSGLMEAYPMIGSARAPTQAKVMVVDDDPIMVRIIERMLHRRNIEVVTTRRSLGVLNLIATHRPTVVLLDVNMPGLGGPSLVTLIREDPELKGTIVLLHSALEEGALAEKARDCGADGFIAKSHGIGNLEKNLDRWFPARHL